MDKDKDNLPEVPLSDYSLEKDGIYFKHQNGNGVSVSHSTPNVAALVRGAERTSPYNSNSPLNSPRSPEQNFNIDAGSAYALQVALRSMKDRYHKLQLKMNVLEYENKRLINGKSELFGEIGKMQENSIKLREKNLQLNHEVHSQHQECCSLKKKFTHLSQENISLTHQLAKSRQDNRKLQKYMNQIDDENLRLKEKIRQITIQVQQLPGAVPRSAINTLVNTLTHNFFEGSNVSKTKIVPLSDELDSFDSPPSRFQTACHDNLDEFEQITESEILDALSIQDDSDNDSFEDEEQMLSALISAEQRMKCLVSLLHHQKQHLMTLEPHLSHNCEGGDTRTLGQRDREISTITINASGEMTATKTNPHMEEDNYLSRLATCGTVINPINITSGNVIPLSPLTSESGGDNNVVIEKCPSDERPRSPFDWRQVQMSDEEADEINQRPETKNASTSPDPSLIQKDENKTCPMCHAVFPPAVSFENFETHVISHFEEENGFEVVA